MDEEIKNRLETIERKLTETHKIVAKIRRVQRSSNTVRLLYWVFLVLLALGAFYFIQPVINQLKSVYGFGNTGNTDTVSNFLNQLNGGNDK